MPHVDAEPTTHYPGCWREHHECAVALIQDTITVMNRLIAHTPTGPYIAWLRRAGAFPLVDCAEHGDKAPDGAPSVNMSANTPLAPKTQQRAK